MNNILPHQIKTSRDNILFVGRMSIKSVIDRSCFETLHDRAPEVINFCNILEHILSFCTRGFSQSFYSVESKRHPWLFIRETCRCLPESCVPTIETMENLKGHYAKLRGWIKLALLQKRLTEYMEHAVQQKLLLERFYDPRSLMRSPDLHAYLNTLMGLTAVDFSFDLRGEDQVHPGLMCIDFTPYLHFIPSDESLLDDAIECDEHLDLNSCCPWQERFMKLDVKYKREAQQKHFLEERLRKLDALMMSREAEREQFETEMKQLESVILELQVQITLLQEQYREELQRLGGDPDNIPSVPAARGVTRRLPPSLLTHRLAAVEPTSRPQVGLQQFASGRHYSSPRNNSRENLAVRSNAGMREEAYETVNDNWDDDDYERKTLTVPVILFPEDEQETSPEPDSQTTAAPLQTDLQNPSPAVTPDVVRRVREGQGQAWGYYRLMDTPRDSDSLTQSLIDKSQVDFEKLNVSELEDKFADHPGKPAVSTEHEEKPKGDNGGFRVQSGKGEEMGKVDDVLDQSAALPDSNDNSGVNERQSAALPDSNDIREVNERQSAAVPVSNDHREAVEDQPAAVPDSNDISEVSERQSATTTDSNDNKEAVELQTSIEADPNDNREVVEGQIVIEADSNDNREFTDRQSVTLKDPQNIRNPPEIDELNDRDSNDNAEVADLNSKVPLKNGGVVDCVGDSA